MEPQKLRENLMLAAALLGLPVRGYDFGHGSRQPAVLLDNGSAIPTRWNPYYNDGDAMRLCIDARLWHAMCHVPPGEMGRKEARARIVDAAVTRAAAQELKVWSGKA